MILLTQAHCKPVPEPDEAISTPAKKKSRTLEHRNEMLEVKTKQVLWILENRLSLSRSTVTLCTGIELTKQLGKISDAVEDIMDDLVNSKNQMKHVLLLDGAVDRWVSEMLFRQREQGCLQALPLPPTKALPVSIVSEGCASRSLCCTWGPLPLYMYGSQWHILL